MTFEVNLRDFPLPRHDALGRLEVLELEELARDEHVLLLGVGDLGALFLRLGLGDLSRRLGRRGGRGHGEAAAGGPGGRGHGRGGWGHAGPAGPSGHLDASWDLEHFPLG